MGKLSFAFGLFSLSLLGACGSDAPASSDNSGAGAPAMHAAGGGSSGAPTSAGAPSVSGGASGAGTAGAGAAGTPGTAGSSGAGLGGAPSAAGAGGMPGVAGGAPGGGGSGGGTVMTQPSAGCSKPAPAGDSETAFIKHDIEVTGVDAAYIAAHPVKAGSKYSFTHRNYYVRLPKTYNPNTKYVLDIGGSGCYGSETVGSEGGYPTLGDGQSQEVQVALSYVLAPDACFSDRGANPPDLQFFDAVLADIEAKYCVDKSRVFVHGYSSGAWESYLLGCARANVIRGIGTVQGGERITRPACMGPTAAILVAGTTMNDNPIGPLDPNSKESKDLDSLGSGPARDEILKRNGCVGTDTTVWDAAYPDCKKYTGCPAAYPVVWCAMPNLGHNYAQGLAQDGFWKFWSSLPAKP